MEISFDCETLGIENDATIISIGAVKFDREHGIVRQFYRTIDMDSVGAQGSVSVSTLMWWMKQREEARSAVFGDVDRSSMKSALLDFGVFCQGATEFWQRGDRDAVWVEAACKRTGVEVPFKFWQLRDQRTLTSELGYVIGGQVRTAGVAHNALSDAMTQAEDIIAIFKALNLKTWE